MAFGSALSLTPEQSKYWFEKYASYLAEDGLSLQYYDADIWLLDANKLPVLNSKPIHQLLHQSLMPELAQLESSMYWQKLITESQMFFASSPNDTLLNGVWPWGDGVVSAPKPFALATDEAFLELTKPLFSSVTPYNPTLALKDYQLILLQELSTLSSVHLKELSQSDTQWYWNNKAYSLPRHSWFNRLWRT